MSKIINNWRFKNRRYRTKWGRQSNRKERRRAWVFGYRSSKSDQGKQRIYKGCETEKHEVKNWIEGQVIRRKIDVDYTTIWVDNSRIKINKKL